MVVVIAFAFRVLPAAFLVGSTVSYINFLRGTEDSIGLAATVAWQETVLMTSLFTASIPCLRPFLWAFMSRSNKSMYVDPLSP